MSQDQEKGREDQQAEVEERRSRGDEKNRTDSSRKRTFVRLLVEKEKRRRKEKGIIQCMVKGME